MDKKGLVLVPVAVMVIQFEFRLAFSRGLPFP